MKFLLQLLLTTSAGLCLHRSGNLETVILVSPLHERTVSPLCRVVLRGLWDIRLSSFISPVTCSGAAVRFNFGEVLPTMRCSFAERGSPYIPIEQGQKFTKEIYGKKVDYFVHLDLKFLRTFTVFSVLCCNFACASCPTAWEPRRGDNLRCRAMNGFVKVENATDAANEARL